MSLASKQSLSASLAKLSEKLLPNPLPPPINDVCGGLHTGDVMSHTDDVMSNSSKMKSFRSEIGASCSSFGPEETAEDLIVKLLAVVISNGCCDGGGVSINGTGDAVAASKMSATSGSISEFTSGGEFTSGCGGGSSAVGIGIEGCGGEGGELSTLNRASLVCAFNKWSCKLLLELKTEEHLTQDKCLDLCRIKPILFLNCF